MALTSQAVQDINLGRGGSYSMARDVQTHSVWDVRAIPAANANFSFFAQGIGAQFENGAKDKQETNLSDNGKLPTGQTFLAKRIGLALIAPVEPGTVDTADVIQAYNNILQHTLLQLKVQGRDFDLEIHGRQFLPSVAITGLNAGTIYTSRVGDYIASGFFSLGAVPIFLDSLVGFTVPMITRSANTYVNGTVIEDAFTLLNSYYARIMVTLEGVLTRAK